MSAQMARGWGAHVSVVAHDVAHATARIATLLEPTAGRGFACVLCDPPSAALSLAEAAAILAEGGRLVVTREAVATVSWRSGS